MLISNYQVLEFALIEHTFLQDIFNFLSTKCVPKMDLLECMYIRQAIDLLQGNARLFIMKKIGLLWSTTGVHGPLKNTVKLP